MKSPGVQLSTSGLYCYFTYATKIPEYTAVSTEFYAIMLHFVIFYYKS